MKYSVPKLLRWSWKIVMAGLVVPFGAPTKAEVTLDGSLGPTGPIRLVDQNFEIPDTVGQTVGTNLFHSFGLFNINTGQSATFTGPSFIENVLGRVTGGSPSFIDGLLRTRFENASPNLFLLNPAGVLFGPNASLDVQGSFHVSTADYLKLGDGGRFEATNPKNSVLTTAPPEAFGFLGENPAGIAFHGSGLSVPEGETLSVIGGNIKVTGGARLRAPGGRVNVASVASAGEVRLEPNDLGMDSLNRLGTIKMNQKSSIDTSGEGGGRIVIRGGKLVMTDNASIFADTLGSGKGQGIDIGVTGQVTMRNGARITAAGGGGDGADLTVKAGSLDIRERAFISASTYGRGNGGQILVDADRVFLSGDGARSFTGIASQAEEGSSGKAGDVTVRTGSLEVRGGAVVSVSTFGSGDGGRLLVEADRVFLSGDGANPSGDGANPSGDGATPSLDEATPFTGITSQANPGSSGNAGDVTVRTGSLEVRNGAEINASVSASGQGGNVTMNATDITLQDGSRISAESMGTGQAGQIFIKAVDNLRLVNGSQISVATTGADAGDITLEVGHLLHLSNGSSITTSVAGGIGDGGNITISNPTFVVLDGSQIIADAAKGSSGNIQIKTDFLLASPDSRVEASGRLEIDSPETDIIGGISVLPAAFLDAATVLTPLCAERSGANVSSLVVRKYEVLPDSPYALRVQLPRAIPAARTAKQSRAPRTYYAGSPLRPVISCLGNG